MCERVEFSGRLRPTIKGMTVVLAGEDSCFGREERNSSDGDAVGIIDNISMAHSTCGTCLCDRHVMLLFTEGVH